MPETPEQLYDKLKQKCFDNAFHSFGYIYIFDERARRFTSRIRWISLFGFLMPALVGAISMGYGIENKFLINVAMPIAIFVSIIQFIFSTLAYHFQWGEELSYAYEASQSYNHIHSKFKNLAEFPPNDYNELNKFYKLIETEYNLRQQQDSKHTIKEWELRKGMRYSLRNSQKECVGCQQKPLSMESTNCNVCGNFSFKNRY